jgi:hypothetical protein
MLSNMRIPMILTATGASLALVLLGACTSADAGPTTNQKSAAASVASTPAESVLVSLKQSTDAKTAQMDLTANINGIPAVGAQKVTGNGSVDFAAQKAQAHFEVLGLSVDSIVDGTTAYTKSALLGENIWYRSDGTGKNAQGIGGFANIWTNMVDPSQLFATLSDSAGSMTELGHEQVRGADTIHYKGEIDLQKRAQAAGAPAEALDAITSSGVSTVPVDVWVDGQGLIARIQTSLSVSGSQGGQPSPLSGDVTVEFHNYGQAVNITAPPADQVKDASESLNSLGNLLPKRTKSP